ncbi:MAG: hypothetical protein ACRC1K_14250 [Planctomycetia bacterium]
MELWGFDGCTYVCDEADLLIRLQSDRRGLDGAFVLSHGGDESLWVHIHGDAAFLWYLPHRDGAHPGFVADGMWSGERRRVRFLQTSGTLADSIDVQWSQLVPVAAAYRAAVEYLHSPVNPASVSWFEL